MQKSGIRKSPYIKLDKQDYSGFGLVAFRQVGTMSYSVMSLSTQMFDSGGFYMNEHAHPSERLLGGTLLVMQLVLKLPWCAS